MDVRLPAHLAPRSHSRTTSTANSTRSLARSRHCSTAAAIHCYRYRIAAAAFAALPLAADPSAAQDATASSLCSRIEARWADSRTRPATEAGERTLLRDAPGAAYSAAAAAAVGSCCSPASSCPVLSFADFAGSKGGGGAGEPVPIRAGKTLYYYEYCTLSISFLRYPSPCCFVPLYVDWIGKLGIVWELSLAAPACLKSCVNLRSPPVVLR